jgi:hypothetical protein
MCMDCTIVISNCLQCTSNNKCDVCAVGYLVTGAGCTKISCVDSYCIACATTAKNTCLICNYTLNYYLTTPSNTCLLCDHTLNMFINMTDPLYPCISCTLLHCITCLSLTQCTVCDTVNQYFLNTTDHLCYSCVSTFPNCLTCSAYAVCQTCNYTAGYYLNTTINACAICDSTANMYINTTDPTYPCVLCVLPNCVTCSSYSQCGTCTAGYVSNTTGDGLCYLC